MVINLFAASLSHSLHRFTTSENAFTIHNIDDGRSAKRDSFHARHQSKYASL